MFTTYAIIQNNAVVEYPVNPRVWNIQTESFNVPEYWPGGELNGKTYVYCHNNPPKAYPMKNAVENNRPVFDAATNLWYRGYDLVDATPTEIAERTQMQLQSIEDEKKYLIAEGLKARDAIENLPLEGQQEWDTYFTDLQNIESQASFPWDLTWPTRPDQVQRVKIEVERV